MTPNAMSISQMARLSYPRMPFSKRCSRSGTPGTHSSEDDPRLFREFANSSLNALLLTPTKLFAIHINSRVDSPVESLRELFESVEALPASHATEYYAMDYRIIDDAVHVISSGLDAEGWTRFPVTHP